MITTGKGLTAKEQGDLDEAETLLLNAWQMERSLKLGRQVDSLVTLSELYEEWSRPSEAAKSLQEAAVLQARLVGDRHYTVGRMLADAALLMADAGGMDVAVSLLKQAALIHETTLGARSLVTTQTWNNLGALAMKSGDYSLAEEFLDKAVKTRTEMYRLHTSETWLALGDLAELRRRQGDIEAAEELLRSAGEPEVWIAAGEDGRLMALRLAEVLFERGEASAALEIYDALLQAHRTAGTTGSVLGALLLDHSVVAGVLGRDYTCESSLLGAIAEFEKEDEEGRIGEALEDLVDLYRRQGRYEEAESWSDHASRLEAIH